MWDEGYESILLKYDYLESDSLLHRIAYYRFRSKKSHLFYIVRVEEYREHVYGVKFYLKSMQDSPRKYSFLTNTYEPRTIVYSIFKILLTILNEDERASFMFIGNADEGGTHVYTRRYRLYCRLVENCISENYFKHIRNDQHSLYILANKMQIMDNPFFANAMVEQFVDRFIFEES